VTKKLDPSLDYQNVFFSLCVVDVRMALCVHDQHTAPHTPTATIQFNKHVFN